MEAECSQGKKLIFHEISFKSQADQLLGLEFNCKWIDFFLVLTNSYWVSFLYHYNIDVMQLEAI